MAILLYRVDERLIHGQVIVGWGSELHPVRVLVVDDDLATSEWEQELYALGLHEDMTAIFATVADAAAQLNEWEADGLRSILLTRDVETMARLAQERRLSGREINIGGLHYAPGRRGVLPYVYLSDNEATALESLVGEGALVSARDLPGSRRVPAERLIRGGHETA
jgi:mannose/fructose/N-acetylgalactosamine-specific phosphotransferase system component IIB